MSFDFTTLVTDRTQSDVQRVRDVAARIINGTASEAEIAEWNAAMKGAYNHEDLNRVENAVACLSEFLRSIPEEVKKHAEAFGVAWDDLFDTPYDPSEMDLAVKTDWGVIDVPYASDMERYLKNVVFLRASIPFQTATLPQSAENLTWSGANAIERVLFDLDIASQNLLEELKSKIEKTIAAAYESGELFSGEV